MRFVPMNGNVVIVRVHPETRTPGGIFLPDGAQKKSELAIVRDVCDEWTDEQGNVRQSNLKRGDAVIVSKYSGEEFELNGREKVVVLKESAVLSRLEEFLPSDDSPLPAIVSATESPVMLGGEGIETQSYDAIPA